MRCLVGAARYILALKLCFSTWAVTKGHTYSWLSFHSNKLVDGAVMGVELVANKSISRDVKDVKLSILQQRSFHMSDISSRHTLVPTTNCLSPRRKEQLSTCWTALFSNRLSGKSDPRSHRIADSLEHDRKAAPPVAALIVRTSFRWPRCKNETQILTVAHFTHIIEVNSRFAFNFVRICVHR